MEFIIENNCSNPENIEAINPHIKPLFHELFDNLNISSLEYFVIADSEEENYAKAVLKYASMVGTEAHVTQDGHYFTAGKSLDGIDEDGRLHQAIVIKSSIWVCAALEYMRSQGFLSEELLRQLYPNYTALPLIMHEIGHAIDNENQYKMAGTVNTKIAYDLRYEYDEYIKQTALSLWGEYYAEAFAYRVIRSEEDLTLDKEEELIKCIKSHSLGINQNALLERIYRILYYFVIRLAFIHQQNNYSKPFDYSAFEQLELAYDYIPFFERTELAIIDLYKDYPKWDTYDKLNELSTIIKDFLSFERRRQENQQL